MKGLFKKTWFHRAIYLMLFVLWTSALWHRLGCLSCTSSLGISYGMLYFPVAILLLVLVITDVWIAWLLFFILSIGFSALVTLDEYYWRVDNKSKVGWSDFDINSDLILFSGICLAFMLLLYLIRPPLKRMADKQAPAA